MFHNDSLRPPAFEELELEDMTLPLTKRKEIYEALAMEVGRKLANEKKAQARVFCCCFLGVVVMLFVRLLFALQPCG